MEYRQKKKITIGLISLYDIENNAVRSIAAFLRKNNYKVVEIYFKHWTNNYLAWPNEKELKNIMRLLKGYRLDLVGISIRCSAYHKVARFITKKIKDSIRVPVVWGGIHTTLVPDKCIEAADILCIGEGEYPMLELVNSISEGKDIENIKNLWVKTKRGVTKNEIRPLLDNLDILPFRDYTSQYKFYLEDSRIHRGDPVVNEPIFRMMVSRGCLYNCSFCYNSVLKRIYKGKGTYYRYRSVGDVIAELKQAKAIFKNVKRIRFDDEVFLFDEGWRDEFVYRYNREIGLPFECFMEPRVVREDYLSKLKTTGLEVVYMGVQNTERISKELYDRPISDKEVLNAVTVLNKLGMDARYQVILDDPISTSRDKEKLFELLMSFSRPFELYLFSMTVFPKTKLAEKLLEKGMISETDIEGRATKTFSQYRIDLSYPRRKEDLFWTSLIVLISKSFIPKQVIRRLSKSYFLKAYPKILMFIAQFCNILKMLFVVYKMTINGEMSAKLFKQWVNYRSLITQ